MKTTDKMQVRIIILLIIVVLFAIIYALYMRAVRFQVSQAREAMRAKGYPVTLQELDRFYPQVPDLENAALVYLEAFSRFSAPEHTNNLLPYEGSTNLPSRTFPIPDNIRAEMKRYLEANTETLRLLREGAKLKKSRYPIDLRSGVSLGVPHLQQIRRAARLLAVECAYHADRGDARSAMDALGCMLALNASLEGEPTLISSLVQLACQEIFAKSLELAMNRLDFTSDQLKQLKQTMEDKAPELRLTPALAGEQAFALSYFDLPPEQLITMTAPAGSPAVSGRKVISSIVYTLYRATGIRYLEEKFLIEMGRERLDYCEQDHFQSKAQSMAHESKIISAPKYYLYSRLILPSFSGAIRKVNEQKANSRLIQTAAAVEFFRHKYNQLPGSLNDLVPEFVDSVPLDPFDGNIIRFQRRTPGYVVYSIGSDEKDDGGREWKAGRGISSSGNDKTFIMEK